MLDGARLLRYATKLLRYAALRHGASSYDTQRSCYDTWPMATTIRSELLRHVACGYYENDNENEDSLQFTVYCLVHVDVDVHVFCFCFRNEVWRSEA